MTPYIENLVLSILTGLAASAATLMSAGPDERDWWIIGATGVTAFCGAFINGARQLHKTP